MKNLNELHKSYAAHHSRLAKLHKTHAEALDDESAEKSVHARLADEHEKMSKLHKDACGYDGATLPEPTEIPSGRGKVFGANFADDLEPALAKLIGKD